MDDVNAAAGNAARELGQWVLSGLAGSVLYVYHLKPKTPLEGIVSGAAAWVVTLAVGPYIKNFIPGPSQHLIPAMGLGIGFTCMFFVGELYRILNTKLKGALDEVSDILVERLKRLAGWTGGADDNDTDTAAHEDAQDIESGAGNETGGETPESGNPDRAVQEGH